MWKTWSHDSTPSHKMVWAVKSQNDCVDINTAFVYPGGLSMFEKTLIKNDPMTNDSDNECGLAVPFIHTAGCIV